jgi:hypothetical protein
MESTYEGVADSAVISLALLRLKRARLTGIPVANRERAIAILRGVKPVPARNQKFNTKPCYTLCNVCHEAMVTGTLCDTLGRRHINCY